MIISNDLKIKLLADHYSSKLDIITFELFLDNILPFVENYEPNHTYICNISTCPI